MPGIISSSTRRCSSDVMLIGQLHQARKQFYSEHVSCCRILLDGSMGTPGEKQLQAFQRYPQTPARHPASYPCYPRTTKNGMLTFRFVAEKPCICAGADGLPWRTTVATASSTLTTISLSRCSQRCCSLALLELFHNIPSPLLLRFEKFTPISCPSFPPRPPLSN